MRTPTSRHVSRERLLHYALWCTQLSIAGVFTGMALVKLMTPPDRLVEIMAWTAHVPLALVIALGVLELLGAIAVAAPAVTRVPQRIVGFVALIFLALMVAEAIVHIQRGELRLLAFNGAVGVLCALVAWGRLTHKGLEGGDDELR
jgi:succinate-acetate transporter protein